jgi:hypothetical protein
VDLAAARGSVRTPRDNLKGMGAQPIKRLSLSIHEQSRVWSRSHGLITQELSHPQPQHVELPWQGAIINFRHRGPAQSPPIQLKSAQTPPAMHDRREPGRRECFGELPAPRLPGDRY